MLIRHLFASLVEYYKLLNIFFFFLKHSCLKKLHRLTAKFFTVVVLIYQNIKIVVLIFYSYDLSNENANSPQWRNKRDVSSLNYFIFALTSSLNLRAIIYDYERYNVEETLDHSNSITSSLQQFENDWFSSLLRRVKSVVTNDLRLFTVSNISATFYCVLGISSGLDVCPSWERKRVERRISCFPYFPKTSSRLLITIPLMVSSCSTHRDSFMSFYQRVYPRTFRKRKIFMLFIRYRWPFVQEDILKT